MIDILEKIAAPLIAAFLGALLAFRYQNKMEKKKNKIYIIATLMAYRHEGVYSEDFVKCLNMVDIVFHDNKKIKDALHRYFTSVSDIGYSGGQRIDAFFDLILEMAQDVGYSNLKHTDVRDFFFQADPSTRQKNKETDL
ncbi:DUF6680 family protein [Chitinophagaceae bacterium LWZ2-11]